MQKTQSVVINSPTNLLHLVVEIQEVLDENSKLVQHKSQPQRQDSPKKLFRINFLFFCRNVWELGTT